MSSGRVVKFGCFIELESMELLEAGGSIPTLDTPFSFYLFFGRVTFVMLVIPTIEWRIQIGRDIEHP